MTSLPSVAAFGSCRAISPVYSAHRRGKLNFVNIDQRWYTHTPPEVLQKIEILTGRCNVFPRYAELIIDVASIGGGVAESFLDRGDIRPDYFGKVDAAIVEISTARLYEVDGYALNQTSFLKAAEAPDGALAEDLKHVGQRWMPLEEIREGAVKIAAMFPRTIYQLQIERGAGMSNTANVNRKRLNDVMRDLADGKRIFCFDPNLYFDDFGVEEALEDINHFTPKFASHLSGKLVELLSAQVAATETVAG